MNAGQPSTSGTPKRTTASRSHYLRVSRILRLVVVGTLTSLLATAVVGYLGVIGLLPVVQKYMEELSVTQRLLDTVQDMRVERMRSGYLNVLVADLENDHRDFRNTTHVLNSLGDQFDASTAGSPVRVQRGFRVLRLPAAPDTATATEHVVEKGRDQLIRYNADILIWGEVVRGDGDRTVLRLRFLPRSAAQTYQVAKYTLDQILELPEKFGNDLGSALAAQVAADAAPAYDSARHIAPLLEVVYARLRSLSKQMPKGLTPGQRAIILGAFGKVCHRIADQKNDLGRLAEAVQAYHTALMGISRTSDPMNWALTQINLGATLELQGWREDNNQRLRESIEAYRHAQEVFGRDAQPMHWAAAENGICVALRRLGGARTDPDLLEDAVATCRSAAEVYDINTSRRGWIMANGNLAAALAALGDATRRATHIHEAVTIMDRTIVAIDRINEPLNWIRAKHDIGWMLTRVGVMEKNHDILEKALAALHEAKLELSRDKPPTYWNTVRNSFAETHLALGRLEYRSNVESAMSRFSEAKKTFEHLAADVEYEELATKGAPGAKTANALGRLGWAELSLRAFEPARATLERASQIAPQDLKIKTRLALCLMLSGRHQAAKQMLMSPQQQTSEAPPIRNDIQDDLSFLREIGIDHPMFAEVEAMHPETQPSAPDVKNDSR